MRLALALWCMSAAWAADEPLRLVNAADHTGGKVSPGEIVVLYPSNVGPAALAGAQLDEAGKVTTLLGDTRVWFDGIAAPMAYTVTGEVGAVVPYEVAGRLTTDVVVEYQGRRSPTVTLPVVESAPALFTLDLSGKGQAAMLNETGCCNSPRNPAIRGREAALYATGEGQTTPAGETGRVSAYARTVDYPAPRRPVKVTVAGLPAEIIYAAEAPNAIAGLLQVNFRVPENAPIGDAVPLVLWIGDTRSAEGVTMAIRSAAQRVLLLEPDAPARQRLEKILSGAGYEVITKTTPQARIDLAIFSLAVPAAEVAALRPGRPQLRLIATAATLGPASLKAADLLGAQAVVPRGVGADELLLRAGRLLAAHPVPYEAEHPAELRLLPGMAR
jgi:uncharacterized protein (TIGR03437 family)